MKKVKFTLILILISVLNFNSKATVYTWTGANGTDFSNPLNWSPNGTPLSTDDVILDGLNNCDLSTSIQVHDFSILSTYSGTFDGQNLGFSIIINGSFIQNGGTFICPVGTIGVFDISILGNFTFTSGTFTSGSSKIQFTTNSTTGNTTISGSVVFNELLIVSGNTSLQNNLNFGNCTTSVLKTAVANVLFAYQGNITITSNLQILGQATGSPTNNNGNIIFSSTGNITVNGASNVTRNKLPNITVNTTGNLSFFNNINIMGNWTALQGNLDLGSSAVNMYGANTSIIGNNAAFDNLNLAANVNMPANAEVKISGAINGLANLTFQPTTSLGFTGLGNQSFGIGGTISLAALNAYSSATSRQVVLNFGTYNVFDSISSGNNSDFVNNGNLTLKATSSLKGRVGRSAGTFSGNDITVETFIPSGIAGWANLGINGVSGQTIANWDTQIPMTCDGCLYSPGAIPGNFYSITGWNEVAADYDTTITSATGLTPGKGFWVYVGTNTATASDFTLINSGPIVQGAGTIPITRTSGTNTANDGFNLIANPYASPISWSKLLAVGSNSLKVDNAIYGWNADIGGGAATQFVSGVQTPNNSTCIGNILPASQAFYVAVSSTVANGSYNLDYNEIIKTNDNTASNSLQKTSEVSDIGKFFHLKLKGANDWDEMAFRIHSEATENFDSKWDAHKMFQSPGYVGYPGAYTKYTTISSKDALNEDYSIHSIPSLVQDTRIPVVTRVSTSGSYTIEATGAQNLNDCVLLKDNLLNIITDLKVSSYVFTINDTTSAPRFELKLCKDESLNAVGISEGKNESASIFITQDAQGAFVKTVFEKNTKASISVYNIIGQKLIKDISVEGTVTNTLLPIDLHNQVVLIKVTTDKESVTKKVVLH